MLNLTIAIASNLVALLSALSIARWSSWRWVAIVVGATSAAVAPAPVNAAEEVYVRYGPLEFSIPVDSLANFAQTGTVDNELRFYFQYIDDETEDEIRAVLQQTYDLDPVAVSQLFYTTTFETILTNLGDLIQTESGLNGRYALRAALILAASEPGGFTLIDVLQDYPTYGVRLNTPLVLDAIERGTAFFAQTNQVVDDIVQWSNAQVSQPVAQADSRLPSLRSPGEFSYSIETVTLHDPSRDRTFPVDIYLPTSTDARQRFPIIVISHGLGSSRTYFTDIAEQFASYGFAVAVPEHIDSNYALQQAVLAGKASELYDANAFYNRPLDVSFMLDWLEQRNATTLNGRLNFDQVGVVGHSFGGYTALALAGATVNFDNLRENCDRNSFLESLNPSVLLQCRALALTASPEIAQQMASGGLRDPRVKAIVAVSPVDSLIFGQEGMSKIDIPVAIGAGGYDPAAPVLPEQVQAFSWLTTPEKYLILVRGYAHIPQITAVVNRLADPQLNAQQLAEEIEFMRSTGIGLMLAFSQVYVADQRSYLSYLEPSYVQSLGTPPFSFNIVQSLPADLVQQLSDILPGDQPTR